ncbi:hypothetical protein FISHEDRAFT_74317 [Fistulina hepatica ATCC 64428]|uniref:Protein-S-isoprenylcysteine O-methyltransferase n=1 Tax=Fistulina hepatica ATCC 64428 TaxID=1128425 RepID=A0A0D7AAC1_9AGAR|nr:hypothetical protein FISHEDRAFT_74317 [Fistulina hepatica ATCC 64428]
MPQVPILGLWVPLHHEQAMDVIAVGATLSSIVMLGIQQRKTFIAVKSEGGNLKKGPPTFVSRLVTPVYLVSVAIAPIVCVGSVAASILLDKPELRDELALPVELDLWVKTAGKAALRVSAAMGLVAIDRAKGTIFKALGKQFHYIGLREKGRIITTGWFARVRHPLYSLTLGGLGLYAVVFWSWFPLVSLGICSAAFIYKIPVEERLITEDADLGAEYEAYKKNVRWRLIPYLW